MSKPTNDLIRIAAAGGGMTLSAQKPTNDLIRIAASAANTGAQLTIVNASSKPTNDLIRIASAGKGCVAFDLSN